MRVLHYISGISPNIGGIEIFVLNMHAELKNEGFKFEILTRYVDTNTEMYKSFSDAGIKIHTLGIQHLTIKNVFKLKNRIESFFKKNEVYDYVHSHCGEDPFIIKSARKHGIKKIAVHVHSYKKHDITLLSLIKRLLMLSNSKASNALLACSTEVGISSFSPKFQSKIIIINNGIDSSLFKFDSDIRDDYRSMLQLSGTFVVGHVGRFDIVKNHRFLVDIFNEIQKKNTDSRLLLVGDGLLKEDIISKCRSLGIDKKVVFMGNRTDVNKILQAMDVFVLPSLSEGFGIVLIEAQAAGIHCVVSKDSIPESVRVTDLIEFISIKDGVTSWADMILKYNYEYNRRDTSNDIIYAGYDRVECAKMLKKLYLK